MSRPEPSEHTKEFGRYIALVPGDDPLPALEAQLGTLSAALSGLSPERAGFRYAEGKWSVREIVGHLVDAERILGYRALSVARGETANLPGFDEDQYAANAGHDQVPLHELLEELTLVRRSHLHLFRHLPAAAWTRLGTANGNPLSVRAAAFVLAGHLEHHRGVLRERYGVA